MPHAQFQVGKHTARVPPIQAGEPDVPMMRDSLIISQVKSLSVSAIE